MSNPTAVRPAGAKRSLESLGDLLPDLQEAAATRRPLWRHPAFLVSTGTTLVAIVVMIVLLISGIFAPTESASSPQLVVTDDNLHLSWSGPEVPYDLFVVGGPQGELLDISQLVTGREAWIPAHARLVDEDSCLLVRPAERNAGAEVGTTVPELEAQGAVRACVADAG
jgi:hypothetical protein